MQASVPLTQRVTLFGSEIANAKEILMMPIASTLNGVDMIRLRDTVLTAPCFGGTAGDYPWDRWEKSPSRQDWMRTWPTSGDQFFEKHSSTTGLTSRRSSAAGSMEGKP